MSLFSTGSQEAAIYKRARLRALWRATAEQATAAANLPTWQPGEHWLIKCALSPTVAGAIAKYAVELHPARLWVATFAASPTTIENLRQIAGLTPEVLLFSRILLSRGSQLLAAARDWAGDEAVKVARIHAKIAVLVEGDFKRCMSITGSANMSKNAGYELMALDSTPATARWLVDQIHAMAADAELVEASKRKKAIRR